MKSCLNSLSQKGFVIVGNVFSMSDVESINNNIDTYIEQDHDGIVYEKGTSVVRAIHGMHIFSQFFLSLAKNDYLVKFSQEYLADSVYIHQYKINMKRAMEGESWPWHQDYIYWKEGDHIETPRLLNAAIALDDITLLNGPLCVINESHRFGDLTTFDKKDRNEWSRDVSSDLTYQIHKSTLIPLIEKNGYEFLTCRAGDVIFFDPQLAHASSSNISPYDRRLMIITYNSVSNAPLKKSNRPVFLCATDFTPIDTST